MGSRVMSQAEYAKARGVSKSMVTQYKHAGRLVLTPDGKVDVDATDRKLSETLHPTKGGNQQAAPPVSGHQALHDARLRDRLARARKAELEADILEGTLVRRADVEHAARSLGLQARDALSTIPDRLAPMLATQSDPGKIHTLLAEELRRVAQMIAAGLEDVSA
jgi:phage terminase Nu1 subunit (DNA packaging protein)